MFNHAKRHARLCLGIAISTCSYASNACAQSPNYAFGVFKAHSKFSETLIAKNAAGTKLFQEEPGNGLSTCLLVDGKNHTVISDPKGALTQCLGLGSNGGVVGWYSVAGAKPPYSGFAYLNGVYVDVVPNATNPIWGSTVNAVSPNGLMAGMYLASNGNYQIFLTYGSTYNYIQIGGVSILDPTGVNDNGVVVAQEVFATMWGSVVNSVLIEDGVASSLNFPGSPNATLAYNINNNGDIAGDYFDTANAQHGFLYSSSKNEYFGPIDVAGAADTVLSGITDKDVVTGSASFPGATTSQAIIGFPAPPGAASNTRSVLKPTH